MKHKTDKTKSEFWRMWKVLQYVVMDLAIYTKLKWDKQIVITSIFREIVEGKKLSVHNFWRGCDVRSRNFTKEQIDDIVSYINGRWEYDPSRKFLHVIQYHNVGLGYHFHIQVHKKTIFRG